MVNRQHWNWKIMTLIGRMMYENPDLRFCQVLSILGLDKDRFYEEPDKTYKELLKIKEAVSTK